MTFSIMVRKFLSEEISPYFCFVQFCRLGAHYRTGNVGTEQDIQVERIINHHSYKRPYGMAHDISLLKLRRPAQINRAVNLACLPGSSGSVQDGKMCWVTGRNIANTPRWAFAVLHLLQDNIDVILLTFK